MSFIEGTNRTQASLLPACVDDYIAPEALVRVVDAFVGSLDLFELGFTRALAASTGRPGYHPGDMLRLYIWGYAHAPKLPSYNLQSVVDVASGLIVHHDVFNDANDSHLLHPMSVAAKEVLEVDQLQVLTDGGYSNAEEVARCERENIEVAAPIKRGAMNSEHFRPAQFIYDGDSDTIRCPSGQTLRPSGIHTRNRAIRYRTSACTNCALKPRCTPGVQRTIHRLVDQGSLDRMEARIHADPSLMTIRRCTVEHPFGTIKRMSGGGRFLTRGLKAVKAEAALSILAFNILHAANAFGTRAITPS